MYGTSSLPETHFRLYVLRPTVYVRSIAYCTSINHAKDYCVYVRSRACSFTFTSMRSKQASFVFFWPDIIFPLCDLFIHFFFEWSENIRDKQISLVVFYVLYSPSLMAEKSVYSSALSTLTSLCSECSKSYTFYLYSRKID